MERDFLIALSVYFLSTCIGAFLYGSDEEILGTAFLSLVPSMAYLGWALRQRRRRKLDGSTSPTAKNSTTREA